jgi:hypothetical protein
MLQRAGRLHRHQRGEADRPINLREPQLWIIAPSIGEDGLPDFGVNKRVYDEHILLRSWLEVKDGKPIAIPENIESLIEAVYDAERPCLQEALAAHWQQTKARMLRSCKRRRPKPNRCGFCHRGMKNFSMTSTASWTKTTRRSTSRYRR